MKNKILIIGAGGFVGKNLSRVLSSDFEVYTTTRDGGRTSEKVFYFDLTDSSSYPNVQLQQVDVIINCAGYGVVKTEKDIDTIYNINYLFTANFYDFLGKEAPSVKLIHIGTAFEYDLNITAITESSRTLPRTHYGISKLMASKHLLDKSTLQSFRILRPFSMFGAYEDSSKIIPYLILAQKNKTAVALSSGLQRRDYLFVEDLATFIKIIIDNGIETGTRVLNIGSGKSISLKEISEMMIPLLPEYDVSLWQWGAIPSRVNEGDEFYNCSKLAQNQGLVVTPLSEGLVKAIDYYWNEL